MHFHSAYDQGFVRVAAATVPVLPAQPLRNVETILTTLRRLADRGVGVVVLPELCLTGYALEDLLLAAPLLDAAEQALATLLQESEDLLPVAVVGLPLRWHNRVLNVAAVVHRGRLLGLVPKSYLPTYREFYERRHFGPGDDVRGEAVVAGQRVPIGPDLLFAADDVAGLVVHVEVCEDMWVPVPPSAEAALAGATVLLNLSGSPITVARAEARTSLARAASARCLAAYAYAATGEGESTTDLSWDGQTFIYEAGDVLARTERFPRRAVASVADVDVQRLLAERFRQGTFDDNRRTHDARLSTFRTVRFVLDPPREDIGLERAVDRFPYVPDDPQRLAQDCFEAYHIQVAGLAQRLRAIGSPLAVIGVSGGLDSTQALLVAVRAMDLLGRPRADVRAYTLPGFATSGHTRSNAEELCRALGVTFSAIDIRPAARQLLADIGHPYARGEQVYDVTFENVQAGLRTDYLFRLANNLGGIVIGTGDLSELALGWATYGVGDQMAHYNVNAGVPKTLVQHLVRWVVGSGEVDARTARVLGEILDTEISPELVPADAGQGPQSTEAAIGPYALHDFTLYHVLRLGFGPARIAFLAHHAWRDATVGAWPPGYPPEDRPAYDLPAIRHWLEVFLRRFFAHQFKRSALPNGPKVMPGGALSPRGDWRMPSDLSPAVWLAELERDVPRR